MASSKNKELLVAAFTRFGRAAVASLAAIVISQIIEVFPQLELGPELKAAVTFFLVPAFLALDKYLRGRRVY